MRVLSPVGDRDARLNYLLGLSNLELRSFDIIGEIALEDQPVDSYKFSTIAAAKIQIFANNLAKYANFCE